MRGPLAAALASLLAADTALPLHSAPAPGARATSRTLAPTSTPPSRRVTRLKITVLSTMLAERGKGEWGYAALVEVDGRRILFDTGNGPETVLSNARALNVDLSTVTDVVLSHNHADHTGGLLALRRELMRTNPTALSRVHVARGIFWSRASRDPAREGNSMLALRGAFAATGATFVEHDGPAELLPGVWFTGPVPRTHAERNWSGTGRARTPAGEVEDNVPEDASLVFDTPDGLVLLTGCGHAGVVNTVEYARKLLRAAPLHAVVGGLHLFQASDSVLAWTGARLRAAGVRHLLAGHCTGIEATYLLRRAAGLDRRTAVVSATGSSFSLEHGIDPLSLAR